MQNTGEMWMRYCFTMELFDDKIEKRRVRLCPINYMK